MKQTDDFPGAAAPADGSDASARRYLVTGGAGFIGSHLVRRLVDAGNEVVVLDDFSTGKRENLDEVKEAIELVEGDIRDLDTCRRAAAGVDYVLHQAALPSVPRSVKDPASSHAVNATGTLNVLIAARDAGVRRVVYAASSSAYGNTAELPKHEGMRPNPLSPYAAAKLAGELYCAAFAASYGLETVALRYFNIYGPRQDPGSAYAAVIPKFTMAALNGEAPVIFGDGEQTRDFTHVDNAVHANLRGCVAPAEQASGRVFNVGCGSRISVNELWRRIRDATGASVEARHDPPRPGDVRDSLASIDATREALDYEIAVPLDEGIRRTVEWYAQRSASAAA